MLIDAVRACIDAHSMIPLRSTVVVAVSGGADSMALLSALYQLRDLYHMQLVVAHVDHQMRPVVEAGHDAEFVEQQAARLRLPFQYLRVDVKAWQRETGLSPQHAAREQRYAALSAVQQQVGASRIAMGHTVDDQAETLLLRLLRGTSPAGLAGIPLVNLPCIRPLMTVSRQMIERFLQGADIPWVEDDSNASRAYLRNQVRHDVLPVLRQANSQVDQHVRELADLMAAENDWMDAHVDTLYQQIVVQRSGGGVTLRRAPYQQAPLALQRRLLRRIFATLGPMAGSMSLHHTEALRNLALNGRTGQRLSLPGGWRGECHRDGLYLWLEQADLHAAVQASLSVPGKVDIPALGLQLTSEILPEIPARFSSGRPRGPQTEAREVAHEPDFAYIDASQLTLPLTVRLRQPGDRFYPYGTSGSKKLSDFFIDKKVPRVERDRVPLVLSGLQIVWVAGYQVADPVKICPDTRQVVCLQRTWL